MFSFWKKKGPQLEDLSFLHTDIHSHLIPGIDDGVKTIEESLAMIKGLKELGFKKIITTPHINYEYYPNTREIILDGLQQVRAACREAGLSIDLHAAAEYYMDEHFESLLEQEALLPLFKNYVLVEMSFFGAPPKLEDYLFRMQTKGYRPVLAHPERYMFFKGDLRQYQRLRDLGALMQVNLLSLAGYYGREIADLGKKLIKNDMVDLLGTDLHHVHHLNTLKNALQSKTFAMFVSQKTFSNAQLFSGANN